METSPHYPESLHLRGLRYVVYCLSKNWRHLEARHLPHRQAARLHPDLFIGNHPNILSRRDRHQNSPCLRSLWYLPLTFRVHPTIFLLSPLPSANLHELARVVRQLVLDGSTGDLVLPLWNSEDGLKVSGLASQVSLAVSTWPPNKYVELCGPIGRSCAQVRRLERTF